MALNWYQRKKVFLAAVEQYELALLPTCGGMTRKLDQLADHLAQGGKLQAGVLFVQSGRGSSHDWLERAFAILAPMRTFTPKERRRVLMHYKEESDEGKAIGPLLQRYWRQVPEQAQRDGLRMAA